LQTQTIILIMIRILISLFIFLTLLGCGRLTKVLKSDDMGLKYSTSEEYYDEGKYTKAIKLFENLAPQFKGKPQAEKMFYMYAQSLLKTESYYLAAYEFERFVASYPRSEKAEEAAYLSAFCYGQMALPYNLDQKDTYKGLESMQAFIDKYPESKYMPQANEVVTKLTDQIEKKAFENAKLYNTVKDISMMNYKSAIVSLNLFIQDFPGSKYKEDALFYKFDSQYNIALNSVESKMKERYLEALAFYDQLFQYYPETKYKEQANAIKEKINKSLNNPA